MPCSEQSGPNNMTPADWGVNYRALHDLFHTTQSRQDVFRYEIGVQMLEIYNEQVRDLLSADGVQKKYPSINVHLKGIES
jgi:kinesin family protein C2/C3